MTFDVTDDLKRRPFTEAIVRARQIVAAQDAAAMKNKSGELIDAMRYAVDGGKALRAFLVIESSRLHRINSRRSGIAALAIEYIHAYSLIHDDLPCMDDDDLRRGKPTVHKKWSEHTAVLAGDALLTMAFELLCNPVLGDAKTSLHLVKTLAQAAGESGMVGGQMMDIAAETSATPFSLDQITQVQNGKTGALIKWSATAGPMIANAPTHALETFGDKLGLAFQIWDDVLDVEGDAETMGKAAQKDADRGKATFVDHLGLDGAKRRAQELVQDAEDALSVYGDDGTTLREAARFVISRDS